MKKVSLFILIVLMLFAFVACDPNSSSSNSADDALLPGEVTPPAESERKSMSDADINKVAGALMKYDYTECSSEDKSEVDFGEDGTLSIKKTEDWKDSMKVGDRAATVTANGKIKVNGDSYVVDNLELAGKVKVSYYFPFYDYTIEKGSITKNEKEVAEKDLSSLFDTNSFYHDTKCKAYTKESNSKYKINVLDDNGTTIGSGTLIDKYTKTKDGEDGIYVYDLIVDDFKIQVKISSTGGNDTVDYVAIDGVFFDKASCEKLKKLIIKG